MDGETGGLFGDGGAGPDGSLENSDVGSGAEHLQGGSSPGLGKRRRRSLGKVEPNPRPIPNYDDLPKFREVLLDADAEFYAPLNDEDSYRWILGLKKIDWFKYFEKQTEVHDLAVYAANSIPNNPVGFLKPEWVDRPVQRYTEACPEWAKEYAENFRKAANAGNQQEMREWFEVIQTRIG
jgi:hypothetical protein